MLKRLVIVLVLVLTAVSSYAVPLTINYQSRLLQPSGNPVADGKYTLQISIYGVPTGGAPIWSETYSSVSIENGLFSILLGNQSVIPDNLFESSDRYFGLKVNDEPEMSPRQRILGSAVSFTAKTVLDGMITTPKLADQSVTSDKFTNGAITAAKLAPGVGFPRGVIVMWSGAISEIPAGWALCDGQNGTPDLRDKFIVTNGTFYTSGATGGSSAVDLTHSHIINDHSHNANHSHGADPVGDHTHHLDLWTGVGPQRTNYYTYAQDGYNEIHDDHTHQVVGDTWGAGGHSHTIQSANFNTAGASDRGTDTKLSSTLDIRPPYYALAFIIKVAN